MSCRINKSLKEKIEEIGKINYNLIKNLTKKETRDLLKILFEKSYNIVVSNGEAKCEPETYIPSPSIEKILNLLFQFSKYKDDILKFKETENVNFIKTLIVADGSNVEIPEHQINGNHLGAFEEVLKDVEFIEDYKPHNEAFKTLLKVYIENEEELDVLFNVIDKLDEQILSSIIENSEAFAKYIEVAVNDDKKLEKLIDELLYYISDIGYYYISKIIEALELVDKNTLNKFIEKFMLKIFEETNLFSTLTKYLVEIVSKFLKELNNDVLDLFAEKLGGLYYSEKSCFNVAKILIKLPIQSQMKYFEVALNNSTIAIVTLVFMDKCYLKSDFVEKILNKIYEKHCSILIEYKDKIKLDLSKYYIGTECEKKLGIDESSIFDAFEL